MVPLNVPEMTPVARFKTSRSAGDGVDLDDRGHAGTCLGRLSADAGSQGVAVRRSECGSSCCRPRQNVDLPRQVLCEFAGWVAVPVPCRSIEAIGKTSWLVSTALTVPLNGVSAATATATLASDTATARTSPTNSG